MIGRIAMVRNRRMAGYHHHNSSFHETCIDDDGMIPAANSGGSIFSPSNITKMDHGSLLAAFKHHWSQAFSVMNAKTPSSGFNPIKVPKNQIVCHNDVVNIANHIDQMTALLSRCFNQAGRKHSTSSNSSHDRIDNFRRNSDTNPLLDYLINESILEKIFTWSCEIGEYSNIMKVEQLKLYEIILCSTCHSHAHDQTFCDKVISPLHKFLDTCRNTCPLEVEKRLVRLLNSLCTAIRNNDSRLLKLFFPETIEQKQQQINSDNNSELSIGHSSQLHLPENGRLDCESRFLIFSLLLSFVHREGIIGQQARNGILQIIPLSTTNESLSNYVAFDSNLAPVMTTILSGLYSSLPRKLTKSDDHPQISDEDIQRISEIRIFVTCLDFCNSIVQTSHPAIEQQMMSLIYQGFLVPVIGPALHEETVQQIITTTAYLELCLRCITDPSLMKIFLKFICIESFDEQRILHTLISRIQASTKLSSISLTLFRTMINLNCEDVMIELIFKHLRNFNQVLSQSSGQIARNEIQDYKSSAQFLSLLPNFSLHSSISSPNSAKLPSQNVRGRRLPSETSIDFTHSYLRYLDDARASIILTKNATKKWAHRNESRNDGTNEKSARGINSPVDSGISTQNSLSNHDDIDGQKSMHDDKSSQSFAIASSTSLCNEAEMIGPFLSNLFSRLSQLPYNDYQLNLIITGLISKLASFSDESLRSLLLDCDLKMHKNVRNLFSVMSHLKRQIEDLAKEVENFHSLLNQTRSAMFSNEFSESIPTPGKSIPGEFKEKRRSGFLSLLSWGSKSNSNSPKSDPKEFTSLESFNDGYKFINRRGASPEEDESEIAKKMFHNQRVVHAAILFEEFVKEMAAIAQEHETLGNYKISL